ncbi:GGDEF domain-containing protein [Candidatus Stoquefichus massiliensis]|uniref:GGDEF domain-containing protein n=1 Tax=Candidatus Stoquefichus massiliensis TaxID=1470350 RepID=UPI00047F6C25|nr:GGDEF domain-containing protein [Candidatus Stoquefichus massiliensis]
MKNPLMRRSIIVAMILLLCFGFFSTVYTNYLSRNLYDETNQFLTDTTIQTALAVKNKMNENITQLQTIALMVHETEISKNDLLDYLNQLALKNGEKRFGIANIQGDVITSDQQDFNISNRQYFQDSLKGKSVISQPMTDYVDGKSINVCSVPVYDQNNQVTAVLFATFSTDKLSYILSSATYNDVGYSFIFNEKGEILLSSTLNPELQDINDISQGSLQNIDVHGNGLFTFTGENQTQNYLIYANVEDSDWLVASVFPQEAATGKVQKFIKIAFTTWLMIGCGSALLISYIYFIQRKNKMQITKLAYIDPITEHDNFNKFIEDCQKNHHLSQYVLVNCDIKGFKWFNEIYGEEIANKLLKTVIHCMKSRCQSDELYCRQEADHFILLLREENHEDLKIRLLNLAHYIRSQFLNKQITSQYYFYFSLFEIDNDDIDIHVAFKKTQYVKKELKELSKDDVIFYQESFFQEGLYAQQIEKEFQDSLYNEHFQVYIQPKVELDTGTVNCGEALVRWIHPEHGIISPGSFIPIYEKNGMLEILDAYVFEKVLQKLAYWKEHYHQEISISINVSRTYLFNEGYLDQFIELIEAYSIHPEQIEIEITETTALNHKEELIIILKKLKKHHLRISLDDFGSGYSSLNMLKDFPIDVVKIDQEFFRTNAYTHNRSHIIIEEVIELCHKLNIIVVAEGVENVEQKDFLIKHHCDYIQGYYYYKPMPINEFEKLFVKETDE